MYFGTEGVCSNHTRQGRAGFMQSFYHILGMEKFWTNCKAAFALKSNYTLTPVFFNIACLPYFSLPVVWSPLFYCKNAPVLHVFRGIHAIGRQKNRGNHAKLKQQR